MANPNDLVSEFSALRASQASQPELRGIKARDIEREDPPRDALLPDSPSQPRNGPNDLSPITTSRPQDHAPDSLYGATSPARSPGYSRSADNFSHPSAAYHTAQAAPTSSLPQTSSRHLTPDFFTFHHESPYDSIFESPIPTESPESLDYPIGTWNDGVYDLASPHAVTTDDGADWNRQVPFSMVKTELAPVEEDDENDEWGISVLDSVQRPMLPKSGLRNTKSFPGTKKPLDCRSDACMPMAEASRGEWTHPMSPAEESSSRWSARLLPVEDVIFDSPQKYCLPQAKVSEPSIEDPLDDVPVRPRYTRYRSIGPDNMEFWDIASDAINCSYALGAEGDSHFDWDRSSIDEYDTPAPIASDTQTDTATKSPNGKLEPVSPSLSGIAARRSSSVYSRSPSPLLPLQTFSPKLDPPSACSTESSFSSVAEAVTPHETTESGMAPKFLTTNCKEWGRPAYIVSNDYESQAAQDEFLDQQMYTSDYTENAPFQLHNVGRIDGSTISNSPRSSRSPISKSSSQESFLYTQAASNARRPCNPGSVGSLPELMSSKNSRDRFDHAVDQLTDNLTYLNPSDCPLDSQQTSTAQRRRSPNLAKDAAQNIMLSKVRTTEEPVPLLPASRDRAIPEIPSPAQDSSMPPPPQPATGRRMRSGSSASSLNLNARGSRGSYNVLAPPHTIPARSP